MGVDAVIEFELQKPLSVNELKAFNFRIGESFNLTYKHDKAKVMDDNPCRYEIWPGWRYYGEYYERGPIVSIIGLLRFMRDYFDSNFDGNVNIFYGSDSSDTVSLWTEETENEVWQHFVKHGHAPYLNYSSDHPCPECNGPMRKGIYKAGKDYYNCEGCNYSEYEATRHD